MAAGSLGVLVKMPYWWDSCPRVPVKLLLPLAKEVPVNYFLQRGPSLPLWPSLNASLADVTVGDIVVLLHAAVMSDLYG